MFLYQVTNLINNKVYIGQTIRPLSVRWARHLSDSKYKSTPLCRAIIKYGDNNFSVKVIDQVTNRSDLNEKEKHYIQAYQSMTSQYGYNVLIGGNDRVFDKETLQKMSNAGIKTWSNQEYKEKMCGKRKAQSLNRYKSPFKVYKAVKIAGGGNKPYVYEKGELLGVWDNQKPCCEQLGLSLKTVSACLNGKIKTHNNLIFEKIEVI